MIQTIKINDIELAIWYDYEPADESVGCAARYDIEKIYHEGIDVMLLLFEFSQDCELRIMEKLAEFH